MRIESVGGQLPSVTGPQKLNRTSESSFGETIKNAISGVNELQSNADDIANKLAAGESVEIHQAMIAMQKASTSLQFTVQVRNKVIEAYQEIMRMQV